MSLLPVDEALARILKSAEPHGKEPVSYTHLRAHETTE